MNDLLDSLVQITKREFSTLHHEEIDIIPLIYSIRDNISRQFEYKNITICNTLPPHKIVHGNNEIITIIISNLLHNAYKFTEQDGEITIVFNNTTLSIHNTGKNISPEDQQKIRTRFWKKNTDSNE